MITKARRPRRDKHGCSAQERVFVKAYVVDQNGTRAAIAARYAEGSAHVAACRLLKRPRVQAAIADAQAAVTKIVVEETAIDRAWIIDKLVTNLQRAMQAEEVLDGKGNPTGKYRYEGNVANRALELIGKAQGMFVERVEFSDADMARMSPEELRLVAAGQVPARLRMVK